MSTIQNLFQQAQLAEAAYANFINPNTGTIYSTDAGIRGALIASGFSSDPNNPTQSAQAAAFVSQWRVVNQYTSPFTLDLFGTGYSGTLFQNIETGAYSLSLRGTNDIVADVFGADVGDIVADGLAMDQVVDLYNYWQSLTRVGVYQGKRLVTLTTETVALNAAYAVSTLAGLAYEATLRARTDIVIDYPTRTVRTIQTVDSTQLSDAKLWYQRYRSRIVFPVNTLAA